MIATIEELKPAIRALSVEDRRELKEWLDDQPAGQDTEADATGLPGEPWLSYWREELERRDADLQSGRDRAIPGDEFMKWLDERLP